MTKLTVSFLIACLCVGHISGHGRMMDPINRSSIWRKDSSAVANYRDDMNFCGGKDVQFRQNGGKCGLCGDSYSDPHPQANENGGLYGKGIIAATYKVGQVIPVSIELTTNHMGSFTFSLCVLNNPNGPESGDDCFKNLKLADGSSEFHLSNTQEVHEDKFTNVNVKLPDGLKCDRCVLRWHYRSANAWGNCADGTSAMGCGDQETFRSCSDIAIK